MAEGLVFLGLLFLGLFLINKVNSIRKSFKNKSEITQQKIEDLKLKNELLDEKKIITSEYSKEVNQIVKEVSDLHQLVMKKYLK
jgi:hypothetical protein